MKLSTAAEFAVRGMAVLAENYGDGPTTLDAVCKARGLSKQYLVKIFSMLTRAALVTPRRGKKGGYLLSRDPSEITLLEIIEAVEGPLAVNFCQHVPPRCDEADCGLRSVWTDIQEYISERLGKATLDQCMTIE